MAFSTAGGQLGHKSTKILISNLLYFVSSFLCGKPHFILNLTRGQELSLCCLDKMDKSLNLIKHYTQLNAIHANNNTCDPRRIL